MESKFEDLLLQRLESIESKLDEIRTSSIPKLEKNYAVLKSETSHSAKIITGIGGLIAIAVSTAVAFLK